MMKNILLLIIVLVMSYSASFCQTTNDSIIHALNGCWKWNHYFGGFAGLPPTPATSDVRIDFHQDAQDSINHTISARAYQDSVLKFTGRCSINDTTVLPFYLLSCPLFDSIGMVGTAPLYFNFEGDTLLFPQEQFVDGFVYAFLKGCAPDSTNDIKHLDDSNLFVYPNPASSQIKIELKSFGFASLKIYNSIGQLLTSIQSFKPDQWLDINNFPEGIYFLRIETSKGVLQKKFFVIR